MIEKFYARLLSTKKDSFFGRFLDFPLYGFEKNWRQLYKSKTLVFTMALTIFGFFEPCSESF